MKDIPNSLAVFCLATYGEGDPTDNAMDFFEWLQNGDVDLTGLNYSVSTFIFNKCQIFSVFNYICEQSMIYNVWLSVLYEENLKRS